MASSDAHHDSTHPNPQPIDRPTPEALVDRFRRKGLFDTLRRDLMKEFQISDLKSQFETKLEEIVLDKLAYDQRRRINDRPARLVVAPWVTLGDRTLGLSATKERHEDVLNEVERHNLYHRTMREVEARFVNHANIESMLYDLLDESRPPSKRRKTLESSHHLGQSDHPPPADKKASVLDSVRLVHLVDPCRTSKETMPAPSILNNLDGTSVVNSSLSGAEPDRLDSSIDGRTDPEAHWPPPEDPLKLKIDLVRRKDTSDLISLTASSDRHTLPSAATSSDIDGVPISRTSVANSFSGSALMVKTSSSRRTSVENPSASTCLDGEPLMSSNMTEQSFDLSDTAGRTVHKPPTSSSSTSKKFPSPLAVPLPTSSVSTPKSIQSTQTLPSTRQFSLSTDHSSNNIRSGGSTLLYSAESINRPLGFGSSAVRPMSSHVSDEDAIDSAVDEFIRSLDGPSNKSEDGERDPRLSASSSRFDGDPLPNSP